MSRTRRTNPPWTDKILAKHWSALEARVGPKLMPVALSEHPLLATRKRQLADIADSLQKQIDDPAWRQELEQRQAVWTADVAKLGRKKKGFGYREYGCGHYGCVMPTGTPGTVIKVTTDQTEAAFVAAYLSLPVKGRPVGIVPYHKLLAIRSESYLKRPVFVLWRDEAQHLGIDGIRDWIHTRARDFEREYYHKSLKTVMRLVGNCLDAARMVRNLASKVAKRTADRIVDKPGGGWDVVREKTDLTSFMSGAVKRMHEAWQLTSPPQGRDKALEVAWYLQVFRQNAEQMTTEPMGAYIGQGLVESFGAGLLLADVHLNNIGLPTGELLKEIGMTPIITDPGHAIPLDDRYAGVTVEEI